MFSKFIEILTQIFFPDRFNCIMCDAELRAPERDGICPECRDNLRYVKENRCAKCGTYLPTSAEFCLNCKDNERHFRVARSALIYENAVQDLIRKFKFGGKKYLAKYMAVTIFEKFAEESDYAEHGEEILADAVVGVPISKKRMRERGFNQSEELANEFCKISGLTFLKNAAVKKTDVKAQAQKNFDERTKSVKGVFSVPDKTLVKNLDLLIIDDVLTTGATASELAHTLLKAGAKSVSVLTYASTRSPIIKNAEEN